MDLWIRSQDKEQLLQVERLFLRDKMICTNIREVLGWTLLGEYSSKERALEVLDKIQEHIGFLNVEMGAGRFGELNFQADIVYEMPKE